MEIVHCITLRSDVYNINSGYNEELKNSSPTLREYMDFVDKVCYYKSVTDGSNEERRLGKSEGSVAKLITQVRKKVSKNKPIEQIADDLECEVSEIEQIYRLITEKPDISDEEIIDIIVN